MRLIDADITIKELNNKIAKLDAKQQIYMENRLTSIADSMARKIELCIECRELLEHQPTAYDVDKVVEQCENVAEKYADCDEFVCSKCGIHLGEWVEVSIDEDYDDEIHSEYVFKYCPNCGAKIKAGD